jgi:hypothetical protein
METLEILPMRYNTHEVQLHPRGTVTSTKYIYTFWVQLHLRGTIHLHGTPTLEMTTTVAKKKHDRSAKKKDF